MQPETKYAWLGDDRIAYQVLGQGPPDLVMTRGGYGHLDTAWEDPGFTLFIRSLASFSRLILFDRRGMGASDPSPTIGCHPGVVCGGAGGGPGRRWLGTRRHPDRNGRWPARPVLRRGQA